MWLWMWLCVCVFIQAADMKSPNQKCFQLHSWRSDRVKPNAIEQESASQWTASAIFSRLAFAATCKENGKLCNSFYVLLSGIPLKVQKQHRNQVSLLHCQYLETGENCFKVLALNSSTQYPISSCSEEDRLTYIYIQMYMYKIHIYLFTYLSILVI